eukprot:gene7213-7979_t
MSFGLLFVPPNERLKPDLFAVHQEVWQQSIRDGIVPPDPIQSKTAQSLGRLFNTGTDDPDVLARTKYGSRVRSDSLPKGDTVAVAGTGRRSLLPSHPPAVLSTASTLQALNALPGGKYHIPVVAQDYESPLVGQPSKSMFNTNTPKMWPAEVQYPTTSSSRHKPFNASLAQSSDSHSFGSKSYRKNLRKQTSKQSLSPFPADHPCSKQQQLLPSSSSSSSSPALPPVGVVVVREGKSSALQETLSQCGRLRLVDQLEEKKTVKAVNRALRRRKAALEEHMAWLKQGYGNRESWHHLENDSLVKDGDRVPSSSQSVATQSTLSQSEADSWIQLSSLTQGRLMSQVQTKNRELDDDPQMAYLKDLQVQTFANSLNPFRITRAHQHQSVRFARRLPRTVKPTDSLDYKDNLFVRSTGNFNACIMPSLGIGSAPSQRELTKALFDITRKQIICYSARIVEIGSLIRAIRDSKHRTPGLQAIFTLHRACISNATLSTNPFLLSRKQLHGVIQSELPWAEASSIDRLLLAFDNTNTGYLRFVRITGTLLACFEPAMASLAVSLDRTGGKAWRQLPDYSELKAEVFVLRFLHRLYCECLGFDDRDPTKSTSPEEARMLVGDLQELLTCCSSSPEDEKSIEELLRPFVQSCGAVDTISAEEMLTGLVQHEALLRDFIRQVKAFRVAAQPYILHPSKSIDDSITLFTSALK